MYDTFSDEYDRFVNWHNRLAYEMPFLLQQFKQAGVRRVLDAACGTGMHAIALAQAGVAAAGADLSAGMIERARLNALTAGANVRFETAGFGALEGVFGSGSFDALLCLGNSLPHLLTGGDLAGALADFGACLAPGGLLVLQNRNFEPVMKEHLRWMEPQTASEAGAEWTFLRFYDFEADGLLTFNVLTLHRQAGGAWTQTIRSTRLRPLLSEELLGALDAAGFRSISIHGDMTGAPYAAGTSGNLVLIARRADQ